MVSIEFQKEDHNNILQITRTLMNRRNHTRNMKLSAHNKYSQNLQQEFLCTHVDKKFYFLKN